MKLDVAKHIVEILLDNEQVRIPGLGNFEILHLPSKLSVGKQKISPPGIDVAFLEESGESDELLNRIKKTYKLRKNDAEKVVDGFTEKVLNSLVNFDRVRITGLGLLVKEKDGAITFKPNKGFISQFYKGLPEVSTQIGLSPAKKKSPKSTQKTNKKTISTTNQEKIVKSKVDKNKSSDKSTIKKTDKKTESKKTTPVAPSVKKEKTPVIEITESLKKEPVKTVKTDQTIKVEEAKKDISIEQNKVVEKTEKVIPPILVKSEVIEKKPAELKPKEIEIKTEKSNITSSTVKSTLEKDASTVSSMVGSSTISKTTQIDEPYVPLARTYDEEEEKMGLFWPSMIILLLVLLGIFAIRQCSSAGSGHADNANAPLVSNDLEEQADLPAVSDSLTEDTASDINEEAYLEDEYADNNNLPDASESTVSETDPNKCIIITGVFRSQRNAQRMKKELKAGGYLPYSEDTGEYIRIGFEFECQDTDLKDFLRAIRRNISKDAWYLQPPLEVY